MPVAAFVKFNSLTEALPEKVHNFQTDVLKIMLTNTLPNAATATKYADISASEVASGNGYTTGGLTAALITSMQALGLYKLILSAVTWTGATAAMGPFRYAVLYNSTATNKELIGYWDNGASISLNPNETFKVDLDASAGVLQLS
jgi:hypothetical protein